MHHTQAPQLLGHENVHNRTENRGINRQCKQICVGSVTELRHESIIPLNASCSPLSSHNRFAETRRSGAAFRHRVFVGILVLQQESSSDDKRESLVPALLKKSKH